MSQVSPWVGIQPYGVSPIARRYSPTPGQPDQVAAYRASALQLARTTGRLLVGYRDTPWGSELTVFGARAGLQRWSNEQAADADVWYAASFDLGVSDVPIFEVAR